ncbi:RNA polymerase subunit sigma-70 [Pseudomonas syringae]|uniref:RNA polymerase subunit sigma-70 n=1 Tax=Pseudomonas syringae TaxID=317 RepID=A0A244EUE6_PSESX|nr:sigma factor-like helix-turn-helix DNA-binding protein [Pseudomonas syringae]OUM08104.1 RNA polymerase subunit sigma-70 [Pseudomonas syringae]
MNSQLSSLLHLPTGLQPAPDTLELSQRLGKLSRRSRQVFLLSRLDGWPYADIARFMDIDVARVERAMLRAMGKAHAHTPSDSTSIQDQASRWYVHLQSPAATASERIEFRHWLDADAAHLSAFQNSERVWRLLQAPASLLGASGWHRRKRHAYLVWCLLTAFLCSLMVTAEAIS